MNLIRFSYFLVASFLGILSCSEKPTDIIEADPEVWVDISGEHTLNYTAAFEVANVVDNYWQFASSKDTNDTLYNLILEFHFKNMDTTGIFPVSNKKLAPPDSDYILISFVVTKGDSQEIYISNGGSANITRMTGTKISGTFNFTAKEQKSEKKISGENGILDIN